MISVIVPCYQHQDIVHNAVHSAVNQTYADIEIIVVDDGSSPPVRNDFGDSRVRVIRHRKNLGLSNALNTGIRHSSSDRFIILAADDELAPECLELMKQFTSADVVSCDMRVAGEVLQSRPGSLTELMEHNCHSYAALVKKSMWQQVGGFKTAFNPSWEDWCFWLDCAKHGATWQHVSRPLHIYNRNPVGRDAEAQGKDRLLWGKLMGYHQDLYGLGKGLVTFVVPCFKHEQYVAEAVQSALDQIYPHCNVVVVDDGSPGDVPAALKDLACDRVELLRQDNRHLSGARNTGISYALQKFNPEYLVMLDADDKVDAEYVERTMAAMEMGHKQFVYTDVKFFGDAWHDYNLEDFDCNKLVRKHQHPCTFLMQSQMWCDIAGRGYGYDESMKKGYEDWEFSLAAVENGWCGKRLPGSWFYYRFHQNGSMRTEAQKLNSELSEYIASQHEWMKTKEGVAMGCKTCGGGKGRFTSKKFSGGKGGSSVFIPGVGDVTPNEMIQVKYSGNNLSTIKKIGMYQQIYQYSGDPDKQRKGYGPVFTIYARDIHLFSGPYEFRRLQPAQPTAAAAPTRKIEVIDIKPKPVDAVQPPAVVELVEPEVVADKDANRGVELGPEDFTFIKGVGEVEQKKLVDAGFTIYEDVSEANVDELAAVLGVSKEKAKAVKKNAVKLIEELDAEEGNAVA